MKIFIHAHYYFPKTMAGAEKYLHEIAKYLIAHGHKVTASSDDAGEYIYDGVGVVSNKNGIEENYVWADAVITHLNYAGTAIALGARFNKPIFHLLHNNDPASELFDAPANNFIIYNSNNLRTELMLSLPSIVARPPIDAAYWKNDTDHYYSEYITLVNVCRGYNDQIIQNNRHRNIQFLPQQPDMRMVYYGTRIVIMPSVYESWGMVASEAMAGGIPVICSDTPGLRENCGDAAIYCEQRVQPYREAIENLSDRDYYNEIVMRGSRRTHLNDLFKILQFMEQQTIIPGREPVEPQEEPRRKPIPAEPGEGKDNDDDDLEDDDIKEKEERRKKEEIREKQQIIKPGKKKLKSKGDPVAAGDKS
jgi:glycosyltransferase involved in cell wall biosynthesis